MEAPRSNRGLRAHTPRAMLGGKWCKQKQKPESLLSAAGPDTIQEYCCGVIFNTATYSVAPTPQSLWRLQGCPPSQTTATRKLQSNYSQKAHCTRHSPLSRRSSREEKRLRSRSLSKSALPARDPTGSRPLAGLASASTYSPPRLHRVSSRTQKLPNLLGLSLFPEALYDRGGV